MLCLVGSFICFYGNRAFRKALFPLSLLFFIMPVPTLILDPVVKLLTVGSARMIELIFKIFGVPYVREGYVFELVGITIEIVEGCSGIRSTLVLFITSIIIGYLFLKTTWSKVILALTIFPVSIFKNTLRISALALLGSYVDPSWVTDSWLHRFGSKPFFVLALLFLLFELWILSWFEKRIHPPLATEDDGKMACAPQNSTDRQKISDVAKKW